MRSSDADKTHDAKSFSIGVPAGQTGLNADSRLSAGEYDSSSKWITGLDAHGTAECSSARRPAISPPASLSDGKHASLGGVVISHGTPGSLPAGISRRKFLWFAGAAALTVALPGSLALSGCSRESVNEVMTAALRKQRTITDDADREVTIPTADTIERVYFTSALAEIYIFSLKPELMAGTAMSFSALELEYLPSELADLPNMGSLSGNGEIDREVLIAQEVQIIFSISGTELTAENISDAEKLQEQTNIPVVLIDGSFDKVANAYRTLGDILGLEDRAEELATYLEDIYERVHAAVENIPADDRITLYYAEGPLGLQTEPDISQHALCFEVAGAINVAAVEINQGLGMSNVSLEQVISWDPEVIIAWDEVSRGGADNLIRSKATWSSIKAVKNGRVYTMPNIPFAWCDRPPGVNRFIGIQWVANMLYPDLYDVDMVEVTQEFHAKMYRVEITTDQALDLLGNSYPPFGQEAKYTSTGTVTHATESGLSEEQLNERASGED